MGISSLGVGSGLALDDLVQQLLDAERVPRETRLNDQEEENEAEISAIGQLKSKLSDFEDAVDDLRRDTSINGRETTVTNPNSSSGDDDEEETGAITAEAANSAVEGSYDIAVRQLATGSRIETPNVAGGGFSSSSDSVLSSGSGSLTFQVPNESKSFSINVTAGMSLLELRNAINDSENNFGVSANLIDTGTTDGGVRLVITSSITGSGNDLQIVNDNDLADLNRVATQDSTGTTSYLTPVDTAQNAIAEIDGIEVQSSTNEFENTIQNVTFDVNEVSPTNTDGSYQTSRLTVGFDIDGMEEKIRSFVDTYNELQEEIDTLTRYGASELENDGALAGDSLVRGIQGGLASIVTSAVSTSSLSGLFDLGIELTSDGELEISTVDIGLGSGTERLDDALEDNFDDVASLFTNDTDGIAVQLYNFIREYTQSGGLLDDREDAAEQERQDIFDAREALDLRMLTYEQTLRDRYLSLDLTVASLNQTGAALLQSL